MQDMQSYGDIREAIGRVEAKLDGLAGLGARVSALENDRAKLIGWSAGVSATVAILIAGLPILLGH
jgi:hypothetical protein